MNVILQTTSFTPLSAYLMQFILMIICEDDLDDNDISRGLRKWVAHVKGNVMNLGFGTCQLTYTVSSYCLVHNTVFIQQFQYVKV